MKKIVQNTIKFIIPLLIGVGIILYLYKGVKLEEIKAVLESGVKWRWIILSLLLIIISHILRAVRWKYQLKSLNVKPSLNTLVNSVFGNYGVNLIFPRLGEIWRCNFMSKRTNQPFSVIFGTLVSERLLDFICIILITGVTILLQYDFFISFFKSHHTIADKFEILIKSPWLYIALAIFIAAICLLRKKIMSLKIAQKVKEIVIKFFSGIKTIMLMKDKWKYIFLTVLIWTLYFFNFYVCLFAFDFTREIDVIGGLTLFVMGSLAIIVPVQGGIGPWHFMIISTLLLFGIGQTEASTFALVVHAFQQAILIILGLYTIIAINLTNKLESNKVQLSV